MKDWRISLAQIAPKLGDLDANMEIHLSRIEQARDESGDLVVFPELSLTGYHLADQVPEVALALDSEPMRQLQHASREIDIVLGFVEDSPGHRFYNTAAYLSSGRIVHLHRKLYLPTYGMFQEGREFASGDVLRAFETDRGPAGMLICEDLWHSTSAWLLSQQGAEVVIAIGNGPTRGTRPGSGITSIEVWRGLLQTHAQFHTTYFVYANRVGCEDGLSFGGGSMVADPFGRVVGELPALDEALATFELSAETLRRARASYPLLRDTNLDLVQRELDRVRSRRYGLSDEHTTGLASPRPNTTLVEDLE
jgi:predicted amidohydrolase